MNMKQKIEKVKQFDKMKKQFDKMNMKQKLEKVIPELLATTEINIRGKIWTKAEWITMAKTMERKNVAAGFMQTKWLMMCHQQLYPYSSSMFANKLRWAISEWKA